MAARSALTEQQITQQIRQVLKICRVWHFKNWSGPMTFPKGISDILGCWQGRMLAIEIKKPGGRISPDQQKFIDTVNAEGGIAFVAWSVDDVVKQLNLQVKLTPLFGDGDGKS